MRQMKNKTNFKNLSVVFEESDAVFRALLRRLVDGADDGADAQQHVGEGLVAAVLEKKLVYKNYANRIENCTYFQSTDSTCS